MQDGLKDTTSLANLAEHYRCKGNLEKYRHYAALAGIPAEDEPAAPSSGDPVSQGLALYHAGRDGAVLPWPTRIPAAGPWPAWSRPSCCGKDG